MRRLLVQAVEEELRSRRPRSAAGASETTAYTALLAGQLATSGAVTHSVGFRMPGGGVLVTLDVQVPVRAGRARERDGEDAADDDDRDDWEATRRAVRGQEPTSEAGEPLRQRRALALVDSAGMARWGRWTLDADAMDDARDALLSTLARHGARIEGLGREGVTVAVRFSARGAFGAESFYWPLVLDGQRDDKVGNDWATWYLQHGQVDVSEQRLVARLSAADLADFAERAPGVEEIARRVALERH
jgi:hypothetical protein